jgi:hypothetical protein
VEFLSKFNSHADCSSSYPLKCQRALFQHVVDTFCLSDVTAFTSTFIARKYCSLFTRHFNSRSCFRGRVRSQYLKYTLALHLKLFRRLYGIHSCFPVNYICDGCRVYSCALKRRLAILVLTLYPAPIVEDWCDTASEEAL